MDFRDNWRPNSTSLDRIRGMLHRAWAWPTWPQCPSTPVPHTLPGSPTSLILGGSSLMVSTLSLWASCSRYTCFLVPIGTVHLQCLHYCRHTKCATEEISAWLGFLAEMKHSSPRPPKNGTRPNFPIGTRQRPSLQLLGHIVLGIVFELLPLLKG